MCCLNELESVPSEITRKQDFSTTGGFLKWWFTLWLCQNSYWKWPFIVDFPMKHGGSFQGFIKTILNRWVASHMVSHLRAYHPPQSSSKARMTMTSCIQRHPGDLGIHRGSPHDLIKNPKKWGEITTWEAVGPGDCHLNDEYVQWGPRRLRLLSWWTSLRYGLWYPKNYTP